MPRILLFQLLTGLIYLKHPKSERRPKSSDVIVVSVRTMTEPPVIVAGAILPVSRIPSFPVQFRINAKNIIHNSNNNNGATASSSPNDTSWNYLMNNQDLVVQAIVCDRDTIRDENGSTKNRNIYNLLNMCQSTPTKDSNTVPSTVYSTPLTGEGIAKLIRYTGNSNNIDTIQPDASSTSITDATSNEILIIRAPVSLPLG